MIPFFPELFGAIDEMFKDWVFPAPNHRLNVVFFWQGVLNHTWPDGAKVPDKTHKEGKSAAMRALSDAAAAEFPPGESRGESRTGAGSEQDEST